MMDDVDELGESELGTQEFWNKNYKHEIENFRSNGDVGEIWFGDDIAYRVVKWMEKNVQKDASIVDIGCGNGMLVVDLARSGFTKLTGVDYSNDAITLAKEVVQKCGIEASILHADIVKGGLNETYDVVLDKGTFDAVSLSADAVESKSAYMRNVSASLKGDGFFVITSCNWTKEELLTQFRGKFEVCEDIPTPQFKFGGKVGSVVTCMVFKKV